MYNLRETLVKATRSHLQGHLDKHLANIEVLLTRPAGIGEHSDITEAIQTELDHISRYHDQVEVINKYFANKT